MSKLLRANFTRLLKNGAFWTGIAFMVLYGFLICITNKATERVTDVSQLLFSSFYYSCVVFAFFCCLFTGTEYSDGTIRNKLIVGHSRTGVYFTNYVTNAIAGVLMVISGMAAVLAVGISMYGFNEWPEITSMLLLDGFLLVLSATAVYTMLAMLIQNKAICVTACLLGTFVLLFLSSYLIIRLSAPEFENIYSMVDGEIVVVDTMKNLHYLPESWRGIYQFAADFLPTSQGIQISEMSAANPWRMAIYSGVLMAVSNLAGIFFFRRKDLK